MKRTIASIALVASTLALGGCASSGTEPSGESEATSASSNSASAAAPTNSTAAKSNRFEIGQRVENGGAAITVNSAKAAHDITVTQETYRDRYETRSARAGGQFVVISTTVENIGKKSLDLTCGYPIAHVLLDVDKREFDSIDSLYRVEGNPECNDNLQPGFTAEMQYVYEIPDSAKPLAFAFYDPETQRSEQVKFINTGIVGPPQ
ncbi:DUF4352 domain-containing protein [Prescottella equi]|uniref:DUF4352 domain-containing protein n=1 Tax=Rhodococcus hoagii TaxID=43767 RepID=UPI001C73F91E|nr:DUF4352 domain-containing protein [Prescottella equi]BCN82794.1 hypothetical protein RE0356_14350 [Prescottella equi]